MLERCRICKGKVSFNAKACLHCGEPEPIKIPCLGKSFSGKKCKNVVYVNGKNYTDPDKAYCSECSKKNFPSGWGL